jgi:hypothetical protein
MGLSIGLRERVKERILSVDERPDTVSHRFVSVALWR